MALGDGFPAASGTVDSVELRKELAGLLVRDKTGNARAGVFPRNSFAIVTALATMNVAVAEFEGVSVRGGGPIFMDNDGVVNVAIAAAPASNSRIDIVYFKQNESSAPFSDPNNLPVLGVVTGTASAAPVKPTGSLPVGATELATVQVPAGATATNSGGVVITQTYQYTTTTGSPIWCRNKSEIDALGSTYVQGTLAWDMQYSVMFQYFEAYNVSTNPGGAKVAGWYPAPGSEIVTRLAKAATTSINTTADTSVTWNTTPLTIFPGMFSSGQPTRLVFPYVGNWEVGYAAPGVGVAAGGAVMRTSLYRNAVLLPETREERVGVASVFEPHNKGTHIVEATTITDYVELRASLHAANGGSLGATTQIWAKYLGPVRA